MPVGKGRGVGGPRQGEGGPAKCVCPKCGTVIDHKPGDPPCLDKKCPKCGASMVGKYK